MKAVIFDFGGVLVRTENRARRESWARRLSMSPQALGEVIFGAENGYAAQLGQWTDDEHWQWVGGRLGLSGASLDRLRSDYFAGDRLDAGLLAYVDRLRAAGLHLGLLSNATDVARRLFREQYAVLDHFDSVTISAEEGVMKPAERIYRTALARAGVEPGEAVFVDDFIENVEAARRIGMQAVHFQDPIVARGALTGLTGVD